MQTVLEQSAIEEGEYEEMSADDIDDFFEDKEPEEEIDEWE